MKQKKHGDQLQIDKEQILAFPIRSINFAAPSDKVKHDSLVAMAKIMSELKKKLKKLNEYEIDQKQQLTKEIGSTDKKIDDSGL